PNYSSLRSKLSYLLMESERYVTRMPPNEIDSIWGTARETREGREEFRFYYGHIFLVGIQRLRLLAQLSGFRLKRILPVKATASCLVLFLPLYPFILLANSLALLKALRRAPDAQAREVYRHLFWLNVHPGVLLGSHLFLEFEKTQSLQQAFEGIVESKTRERLGESAR
ncbi:MAG: hypothetical protein OEW39_13475, partial [Deltaproteobacteria bacterium]|nr:hypothetical protein [Deltaproteobacteria bacterium]